MKIVYLTDSHIDEPAPQKHGADARQNFEHTLAEVEKAEPNLVIFGGDIGTPESHSYFFESLAKFNLKLVLGNHDLATEVSRHYPEKLKEGELFYSFTEADHTFVFLDSSSDRISHLQLAFLKAQVESAERILLFIHHPVLAVDSPVDLKYPLTNREDVKQILFDSGKPVGIFCGHNHCEDETSEANITQYLTPAISYQILKHTRKIVGDVSYFSYRMIHLSPDGFVTNEVRLNP